MFKKIFSLVTAVLLAASLPTTLFAYETAEKNTSIELRVDAAGSYMNWDGVSNVAQFVNADGDFCFAYDGEEAVTVVRTNSEGKIRKKRIVLKKTHPIFGTVLCDKSGNYFVVTGEENPGDDRDTDTIFVTKYTSKGKIVATAGDDGSSSLASYYPDDFRTRIPFDGGNCSAAINGDLLSINYARQMYNGHQSNSVFTINTKTMEKVENKENYNSHSFAQRVIPFGSGFAYASEGDCYPRAFTVSTTAGQQNDVFHFWVEKGTFDNWDMYTLNNNFAHLGALVNLNDKRVALIGTSAVSLSRDAESENEQLFIQIFDPEEKLSGKSDYVTKGKRSGMSGKNGDEQVTDYGVKWLTSSKSTTISNPQAVSVGDKIVILYECSKKGKYKGTYYAVLDSNGKFLKKPSLFSKTAKLNPCTMPVCSHGRVCWVGNTSESREVHIYSLEI